MGWWARRKRRRALWLDSAERLERIADRISEDPDADDIDLAIAEQFRVDAGSIRWRRGFIIRGGPENATAPLDLRAEGRLVDRPGSAITRAPDPAR